MKKYLPIVVLILSIVNLVVAGFIYSTDEKPNASVTEYKKREARRDSLLATYSYLYEELELKNDSLQKTIDSLSVRTDSSIVYLQKLTNPQVSDGTVIDALQWIKSQQ